MGKSASATRLKPSVLHKQSILSLMLILLIMLLPPHCNNGPQGSSCHPSGTGDSSGQQGSFAEAARPSGLAAPQMIPRTASASLVQPVPAYRDWFGMRGASPTPSEYGPCRLPQLAGGTPYQPEQEPTQTLGQPMYIPEGHV